ncbi:unnamed protein product, partial [Gulo gulo]
MNTLPWQGSADWKEICEESTALDGNSSGRSTFRAHARRVVPAEDSPKVPEVWGLLRTECSFSLNLAEALV